LRHVALEQLVRARRCVVPQRLDENLDGDYAICVEDEAGEKRARLAGRERDGAALQARFERPEQSNVDHSGPGIIAE
jgi:hypothetical protein